MKLVRRLSIRNKLRLMILVTSSVALLLACGLVAFAGTVWYKHKIADELATLAEVKASPATRRSTTRTRRTRGSSSNTCAPSRMSRGARCI